MHFFSRTGLFMSLLLILLLAGSGCQSVPTPEVAQAYEAVAVRRPRDVAMSPGMPPMMEPAPPSPLILSSSIQWVDGTTYDAWSATPLEPGLLAFGDPIFSDVYYKVELPGARVPELYTSGSITLGVVYWVDSRIGLIAAPGGSPVTVVEKPLTPEVALAFEEGLASRGFDVGEVDGVIDARTRNAVNAYLEAQGLPYRFATPVISEALFLEITSSSAP